VHFLQQPWPTPIDNQG